MKDSHLSTRFVTIVLFSILTILLANGWGVAHTSTRQLTDKSLDIERHADEPLELIELTVSDQPITDKILTKSRRENEGLDTVSFKEQEGWFKHLQVRLRNISGKPIYGVRAHLFFQPSYTRTLFSLPLTGSTQLGQGVLEPGAEISLTVTDQAWSLTADILLQHGINPDLGSVTFGIDVVRFSDDLQWSKGHMLKRDTHNANQWIPVDKAVPK